MCPSGLLSRPKEPLSSRSSGRNFPAERLPPDRIAGASSGLKTVARSFAAGASALLCGPSEGALWWLLGGSFVALLKDIQETQWITYDDLYDLISFITFDFKSCNVSVSTVKALRLGAIDL